MLTRNCLITGWIIGDDMKLLAVVLAVLLLGGVALATTWAPAEKTDPMTGEKVPSQEIMSYGGYIYNWPSKYDLVFWPLTDGNWVCLNPKNGYAAFNNDFEKLSDAEKEGLSHWLKENYKPDNPPKSHQEKLAWLEKIYGQRKMDDEFWCRFYRLMAYEYREDEKTSIAYVRKAVPLLEKKLASNPEGITKLEVLYLLGEYHRRLGDGKKAQEFFSQVKDVKYKDKEGKEQTGHPYFVELVKDRQKLMTEKSSNKPDTGDGK
jgi:uncharacterized protein (DUF2225 family)